MPSKRQNQPSGSTTNNSSSSSRSSPDFAAQPSPHDLPSLIPQPHPLDPSRSRPSASATPSSPSHTPNVPEDIDPSLLQVEPPFPHADDPFAVELPRSLHHVATPEFALAFLDRPVQDANYVPRPLNCFMLFRAQRCTELQKSPGVNQSVPLGDEWNWLKENHKSVVEYYQRLANMLKEWHKKKYPEYKFKPKTQAQKAAMQAQNDHEDDDESQDDEEAKVQETAVANTFTRSSRKRKRADNDTDGSVEPEAGPSSRTYRARRDYLEAQRGPMLGEPQFFDDPQAATQTGWSSGPIRPAAGFGTPGEPLIPGYEEYFRFQEPESSYRVAGPSGHSRIHQVAHNVEYSEASRWANATAGGYRYPMGRQPFMPPTHPPPPPRRPYPHELYIPQSQGPMPSATSWPRGHYGAHATFNFHGATQSMMNEWPTASSRAYHPELEAGYAIPLSGAAQIPRQSAASESPRRRRRRPIPAAVVAPPPPVVSEADISQFLSDSVPRVGSVPQPAGDQYDFMPPTPSFDPWHDVPSPSSLAPLFPPSGIPESTEAYNADLLGVRNDPPVEASPPNQTQHNQSERQALGSSPSLVPLVSETAGNLESSHQQSDTADPASAQASYGPINPTEDITAFIDGIFGHSAEGDSALEDLENLFSEFLNEQPPIAGTEEQEKAAEATENDSEDVLADVTNNQFGLSFTW
ncbi:hypothetical protein K474DRAFT_720423 [Panus rudis PR-1116 ss-1]|nr:hypothetical protein K474DRAFT_720423 [Panus rudis PR-1116 ss-1]